MGISTHPGARVAANGNYGSSANWLHPLPSNSVSSWLPSMTQGQGIQWKPSTAFREGLLMTLLHVGCITSTWPEVRCLPALAKAISTFLGDAGDDCVLNKFVLLFFFFSNSYTSPYSVRKEGQTKRRNASSLLAPTWRSPLDPLSHSQPPLSPTPCFQERGPHGSRIHRWFLQLNTMWGPCFYIIILSSAPLFPISA